MKDTAEDSYADRLEAKQQVWWKKVIPVQLPYQLNLRRQQLGVTLDIGCGIGRNLATLPAGSLGVDHNAKAIATAKALGHDAMTVDEFKASDRNKPESFDGFLVAHVIEHIEPAMGLEIMRDYLPLLKPGGKVFFVCPQEVGYRSDPTHVYFAQSAELEQLSRDLGLVVRRSYSFPFPRPVGKVFIYNEFCVLAEKPIS